MPTSHDPRTERVRPTPDHEWMVHLAVRLADDDDDRPPELVAAAAPSSGPPAPPALTERHALPSEDPVEGLLGVVAPDTVEVVGLVGPSRARTLHDHAVVGHGRFVHLCHRDGTSITVVPPTSASGRRSIIGPTGEVQRGRVPDACRRILGLATAPPPGDTTDLVLDQWLDAVLSASLVNTGLTWPDVVDCHPVAPLFDDLPTGADQLGAPPARNAARLAVVSSVAGQRTWDDVRRAALGRPGPWDTRLDACTVLWMDTGMFARWVQGDHLPRSVVLDALERNLPGATYDCLVAALELTSSLRSIDGRPTSDSG
jgi:hypothetical protein